MPIPTPQKALSVNEYLTGELNSEIRHEYVAGHLFAMVGANDRHNLIAINIASALHHHLRGNPCQVFMSDMKIRLQIANDDIFYYPDILVCCDPNDRERYYRTRPALIVEILSEATERIDRREKFLAYQTLPSLKEYILVAQNRKQIMLFRKTEGWNPVLLQDDNDRLEIDWLKFSLSLSEVYEGAMG